jgi:hypothetical protein
MNNFNGGSSSMGGYGGLKPNTGFGSKGNSTGGSLRGDKVPKGYEQGQLQQFSPEQMQLFQQLFQQLGPESFLAKLIGGDEEMFEQMEAPAHRQFQGQLGQIASRFSQGGTGGRRGSGFQNTATAAASNFSQDLASKRMDLQRNALNDLMGFSNQLLQQRPQDRFLVEKPQKQNPWADIVGQFSSALPGAVSSYFNPLSGLTNAGGTAKF